MKVQVTTDDGVREVDVDFGRLTLQESVLVEQALGAEAFDDYVDGLAEGRVRPSAFRALVWAKLRSQYPVELDGFDLDLGDAGDTEPNPTTGS